MKALKMTHVKTCLKAVSAPARLGSVLCLAVVILFASGLTAEARQHHRTATASIPQYTEASTATQSHLKRSARHHHHKHAAQSKHHTRHHRISAHHHAHGSR